MADGNVIKQFIDSVKEPEFESNKANLAVVSRVDSEGIVWVHLAGAQKETPTASTSSEVKSGDVVSVEWRNNKLYIGGNYSNPSAGVIRVGMAENTANVAYEAAENAIYDAGRAREAADQAEASAQSALTSANEAKQSADEANSQATYATNYANNALTQLSTVESVVDALTWISEHSVFIPTEDTTVQTSKLYYMPANNTLTLTSGTTTINGLTFAVDAESGTVTVNGTASKFLLYSVGVPNVTTGDTIYISGCSGGTSSTYDIRYGNGPGSYVCYDGTTKATATEGKPIYIKFTSGYTATDLVFTPTVSTANDGFEYKIVQNPTGNPSAQGWYELSTDEAVKTYVKSHLALTDDGLYVLNGSSAYKMLLANDGTYIQAPNGTTVNQSTADGNVIRATNGDVIAHLGYGRGASSTSFVDAPYYTFGTRRTVNEYSATAVYAVGDLCYRDVASPVAYRALYQCKTAIPSGEAWNSSHWRQIGTIYGNYSVVEGENNISGGYRSHTEGKNNINQGDGTHVEGQNNEILHGSDSHFEGAYHKVVDGSYRNHVQGYGHTIQNGAETVTTDCFVSGVGNRTSGVRANTVIGRYATTMSGASYEEPWGDHAFKIGNGTSDNARSNALTVDWNGNVEAAGEIHGVLSSPTISISSSTGSLNDYVIYRQGNVVQLCISVRKTTTTETAKNIYVGTINTTGLRPKMNTTSGSYYGSYAINGLVSTTGTITIRNSDSRKLAAMTSDLAISFTYLVD